MRRRRKSGADSPGVMNAKPGKRPTSKLRNFGGFIRFFILLDLLLLLAGFAAFAVSVEKSKPAAAMPKADGIVVLTGGTGRMLQGGQLLQDGYAERLLATGVARAVSQTDLIDVLGINEAVLRCCVDIDIAAQDTVGNARETAVWAAALGYEHIILVTSDYHMARAKLEITTATGGIRITPFPVDSYIGASPYTDSRRIGLLWREYLKLLAVYVRDTGNRKEPAPQPVPAPADVMRGQQKPPTITGPVAPVNPAPITESETP